MTRIATSFVLGFHGCDLAVAKKAVFKGVALLQSEREYDWLGPGAYFWESDPRRAMEWAIAKAQRGDIKTPTVVGAVIDLGNCLDLATREDAELFRAAYYSFRRLRKKSGLAMPRNLNPKGVRGKDRLLRYLDCAVFRHLHVITDQQAKSDPSIEAFDTVRSAFIEGKRAFPGSGVHLKSHIQIAVRNPSCIKGVFLSQHAS